MYVVTYFAIGLIFGLCLYHFAKKDIEEDALFNLVSVCFISVFLWPVIALSMLVAAFIVAGMGDDEDEEASGE